MSIGADCKKVITVTVNEKAKPCFSSRKEWHTHTHTHTHIHLLTHTHSYWIWSVKLPIQYFLRKRMRNSTYRPITCIIRVTKQNHYTSDLVEWLVLGFRVARTPSLVSCVPVLSLKGLWAGSYLTYTLNLQYQRKNSLFKTGMNFSIELLLSLKIYPNIWLSDS